MSGWHDGSIQEQEERRKKEERREMMRELQRRIDEILGEDATPAARARAEMALRTADRPESLAEQKRKEREREARAGVFLVGIAVIIVIAVIILGILGIVANLTAAEIARESLDTLEVAKVSPAPAGEPEPLDFSLWRDPEPQPLVGPPRELMRSRWSTWWSPHEGISARNPSFWAATAVTIAGGILIYQMYLSTEGGL